jgi:capsular exopolysaccharide synthesis family protein
MLWSRAWLVILSIFVCGAAAIVYLMVTPKVYESRAVVEVEAELPNVVNFQKINPEEYREPEDLKTVEQAFMSDTLLLRVIKANGLDKDPAFAPPKANGSGYLDSELVQRFKAKVSVTLRHQTRLIDINVRDTDPKRAQQLASSLVREFVDQSFDEKLNTSKTANDFLLQEAERLKAKLRNSEEAVEHYREEHPNAVSLEDRQNIIVEKLKELNMQVTRAKAERLKLEADVATIKEGKAKTPEELLLLPSVASLPHVIDLRKQLADKQSKFKAASQLYGLQQTLNRTLLNAGDMVIKSYQAAKTTEAKLLATLKEQEQTALDLNRMAVPYNDLVREVEADRTLYESVLKRMKETNVTKSLEENNLRLVQSPLIAAKPVKPNNLKILLIALLGGSVVGCGLVLGFERADSSVRSVDQAERISGLPVLALLPESKRKDVDKESVFTTDPASCEAEAFRSLRTTLSLLGPEQERKTVLFTSANPMEGKSYCALNYAVGLAQVGLRTLLIDADLRRKRLSELILLNARAPGITSCLFRPAAIVTCCRSTGIENLFILGAGGKIPKPAELLASGDFPGLLEEALLHFDRIVLDSAPINAVSDTRLIAKDIQSICLVVRVGKTPQRAVLRACSLLAKEMNRPDGIVLNGITRRFPDNYYSSEYSRVYADAGANGSEPSIVRLLTESN